MLNTRHFLPIRHADKELILVKGEGDRKAGKTRQEIAAWVKGRLGWLTPLLGLPAGRTPPLGCRRTFERLLRRLDPDALQKCFIQLTARLAEVSDGRPDGRLIAIDGKTLRGSFDHAHRSLPIHRVHASGGGITPTA